MFLQSILMIQNHEKSFIDKDLRMPMCQDSPASHTQTWTHTEVQTGLFSFFSLSHSPTHWSTEREREWAVLILLSPGCWECVYLCECVCIKGIKALAQLRYHQPSTLLVRFGLSRLPHCLFCSAMWKMLNINNGFQWCIVEFLYELILPQWKRPRAWTKRLEPQHS